MKYLNKIDQVLNGRNIHEVGITFSHPISSNTFCSEVYKLTNNPQLSYYWKDTYNERINEISRNRDRILREIYQEVKEIKSKTINPSTGLTGEQEDEIKRKKEAEQKAREKAERIAEEKRKYPNGRVAFYNSLSEEEKKRHKKPAALITMFKNPLRKWYPNSHYRQ